MPPRVATARLQPRRPPASANLPNKAVPCLLASNPSQKLESRSSLKGNPLSDSVSSDLALAPVRVQPAPSARDEVGVAEAGLAIAQRLAGERRHPATRRFQYRLARGGIPFRRLPEAWVEVGLPPGK